MIVQSRFRTGRVAGIAAAIALVATLAGCGQPAVTNTAAGDTVVINGVTYSRTGAPPAGGITTAPMGPPTSAPYGVPTAAPMANPGFGPAPAPMPMGGNPLMGSWAGVAENPPQCAMRLTFTPTGLNVDKSMANGGGQLNAAATYEVTPGLVNVKTGPETLPFQIVDGSTIKAGPCTFRRG